MMLRHRVFQHPPAIIGGKGSSKSILLPENLPDPLLIRGLGMSIQGAPWPAGTGHQIFAIGIDPKGEFTERTSFPANESAGYDHLISLGLMESWPGWSKYPRRWDYPLPYRYSRSEGDRIWTEAYDNGQAFVLAWFMAFEVDEIYEAPPLDNMVDTYTMFLLADDGISFQDRSFMGQHSPHPMALTGNAQLGPWTPYATGNSLLLDGTGGLEVATSPDLQPQPAHVDFTWDFWFKTTDLSPDFQTLLTKRSGVDFGMPFHFAIGGGRINATMSSSPTGREIANSVDCGQVILDATHHFLCSRRANTFRVYLDGVKTAEWTASGSIYSNSAPMRVGFQDAGYGFHGAIAGLRLTNHFARRYGDSFTPWPIPPV